VFPRAPVNFHLKSASYNPLQLFFRLSSDSPQRSPPSTALFEIIGVEPKRFRQLLKINQCLLPPSFRT